MSDDNTRDWAGLHRQLESRPFHSDWTRVFRRMVGVDVYTLHGVQFRSFSFTPGGVVPDITFTHVTHTTRPIPVGQPTTVVDFALPEEPRSVASVSSLYAEFEAEVRRQVAEAYAPNQAAGTIEVHGVLDIDALVELIREHDWRR